MWFEGKSMKKGARRMLFLLLLCNHLEKGKTPHIQFFIVLSFSHTWKHNIWSYKLVGTAPWVNNDGKKAQEDTSFAFFSFPAQLRTMRFTKASSEGFFLIKKMEFRKKYRCNILFITWHPTAMCSSRRLTTDYRWSCLLMLFVVAEEDVLWLLLSSSSASDSVFPCIS